MRFPVVTIASYFGRAGFRALVAATIALAVFLLQATPPAHPPLVDANLTACVDPPPGMEAWWRAQNSDIDHLGNHDGNSASAAYRGLDASPGGYIQTSPRAFDFNGASSFVSVPDSPAWDLGTNDFTFDFWLYIDALPGGQGALLSHDDGGGSTSKWIFWLLNSGDLQLHTNTTGSTIVNVTFDTNLTAGSWIHIALVRDYTSSASDSWTVYVDGDAVLGVLSSGTSLDVPNASAALEMGRAEGAFYFDGAMDDVEFFSRALTDAEVDSIFGAGTSGKCVCEDGPKTTWPVGSGGNGHAYQVVCAPKSELGGMSWEDANAAATAMGGYLATLTSDEENDFVFSLLDFPKFWRGDPPPVATMRNVGPWIGALQTLPCGSEPAGCWTWVTGEAWSFTAWAGGEPNNSGVGEHWAHFWDPAEPNRTTKWADAANNGEVSGQNARPIAYVVEWEAGTLEVRKFLWPLSDRNRFNLWVDGEKGASNVGMGGTTGDLLVEPGEHVIKETGSNLSRYFASLTCRDDDGTGEVVFYGVGPGPHTVDVEGGADVVCVMKNIRKPGR